MAIAGVYHPDFEAAFESLLLAAADTAEFASGKPTGRSRQASIRKLAAALRQIESVALAIQLETAIASATRILDDTRS